MKLKHLMIQKKTKAEIVDFSEDIKKPCLTGGVFFCPFVTHKNPSIFTPNETIGFN